MHGQEVEDIQTYLGLESVKVTNGPKVQLKSDSMDYLNDQTRPQVLVSFHVKTRLNVRNIAFYCL